MSTGERIRKLGFKRWYERTLIESHAFLVSSFLGMILTFSGIELIGEHESIQGLLLGVAGTGAGAGIMLHGMNRYFRSLLLAETLSDRATCPRCHAYGAFTVEATGSALPARGRRDAESSWLKVKCRKCGSDWIM
ncbi:MAG TPA: hypothetical protein VIL43_00455 [Burkholderiales bacterium]